MGAASLSRQDYAVLVGLSCILLCLSVLAPLTDMNAGSLAQLAGGVAVGAVGMDLPRRQYYAKELTFRLARSYGPGRHDPAYEQDGVDYPIGFIRWTIARNLGHAVTDFTAVTFDMHRHYRPTENVVRRPVAQGGQGYYLIGHHELLVPLWAAAVREQLP